ncbi:hypothetical protein AAF712_015419, partial [Marasmius tenuissimus]
MDKISPETFDLIISFVPPEVRRGLIRVSRHWYACLFPWAYQHIFLRDSRGFHAALDFWARLSDATNIGPSGFPIERWKAIYIGKHRMLRTPRTITLGRGIIGSRHSVETQFSCEDLAFAADIGAVFDFFKIFPRITVLCIRVLPFPVDDLLELLARVPHLETLNIDASCTLYPAASSIPQGLTVSLLPQALRSLSLTGMHLPALGPSQWEMFLLLADLRSLENLQMDVVTWNSFYHIWASRKFDRGSYRLRWWYWVETKEPVFIHGGVPLDGFILSASGCNKTPQHGYALSAVGEYLTSSKDTLRSFSTPLNGSDLGRDFDWSSFRNLGQYRGAIQDLNKVNFAEGYGWHSVSLEGVGDLDMIDFKGLQRLKSLEITLRHERDIGFVLAACPDLQQLHLKVLAGNL